MKDKYFLYVGNAYPHKNLEVLLRAFWDVSGAKLILVGKDDFFYKRLRQSDLVRALGNRVIFKTKVSDSALMTFYKNAQAFVFPSLMEGFGLPALEALENGCPVIVSDIPVFHEILGNAPVYFDPHDAAALSSILIKVAKNKPTVNADVVKKYSWQKMAKETLFIYEACARV